MVPGRTIPYEETGLLVQPGDAKALADSLLQLRDFVSESDAAEA